MKVTELNTVDDIRVSLDDHHYIANRSLATSIYLSLKMDKPIFLEGEPGVGKTAIVEGLAIRIIKKMVPRILWGEKLLALDLAGLIAGTKYRGQFEERM